MPPQGGVDLEQRRFGRSNDTDNNGASDDDDDNDRSGTNTSQSRGVSFAAASAAATKDSITAITGGGSGDGDGGDSEGGGGIRRDIGRCMGVDNEGVDVRRDGNGSELVTPAVVGDEARGRNHGVSLSPSRRSVGDGGGVGRQSGGNVGYGTGGDGAASGSDSQSDSHSTRSAGTMCSSNSGSREALLLMMAEEGSRSSLAACSRSNGRGDVDAVIGGRNNNGESASAAPLRSSLTLARSMPPTPASLSPLPELLSPDGSVFAKDPRDPEHCQVDEQYSDGRGSNDHCDDGGGGGGGGCDGDGGGRYEMNDVSAGAGTETTPVHGNRKGWHCGGVPAADGTDRHDRQQTKTPRRNNDNSDPGTTVERPLEHANAGAGDDDDDDPPHQEPSEDCSKSVRGPGVEFTEKGNKRPFSDGTNSSADFVRDPAPDGSCSATDLGPYSRRLHLRRRLADG